MEQEVPRERQGHSIRTPNHTFQSLGYHDVTQVSRVEQKAFLGPAGTSRWEDQGICTYSQATRGNCKMGWASEHKGSGFYLSPPPVADVKGGL